MVDSVLDLLPSDLPQGHPPPCTVCDPNLHGSAGQLHVLPAQPRLDLAMSGSAAGRTSADRSPPPVRSFSDQPEESWPVSAVVTNAAGKVAARPMTVPARRGGRHRAPSVPLDELGRAWPAPGPG